MITTKKFFILSLFVAASCTIVSAQVSTVGLIGDYSFNGNANDNSPLSNNGVIHGAITQAAGQSGVAGTAYRFAGGTSYIELPHNAAYNVDTAITLYAVFKAEDYYTAICQGNHLISRWASTGTSQGSGFGLLFSDQPYDGGNCSNVDTTHDVIYGSTNSNNWQQNLSTAVYIKKNQWYCVAFTHSQHTETMYVNGVVTFSGTVPDAHIGSSTTSIRFGADNYGVNSFKGVIDEIKIYNRALSASEISNLCSPCPGSQTMSIQAFGPTTFCQGSDVLLKVNGGIAGTYHWERNNVAIAGATSNTYTATLPGDYKCVSSGTCGTFTSNQL